MKIGILTFHETTNYGAVLQAYALNRKCLELGYESEIIDYKCEKFEKEYKTFRIYTQSFKGYIGAIIKVVPRYKLRKQFKKFKKNYLNISENKYDRTNINYSNEIYDMFITGSDQVWNYKLTDFDKTYFLDFVKDSNKKNSYSASFGISEIPAKYINQYNELLKDYNHMAVREAKGKQIIYELFEKEVELTLDPTFLIEASEWEKLAIYKHRQPYILVYQLHKSELFTKNIKKIIEETGLKVIFIQAPLKNEIDSEVIRDAGPQEFLGLFKNAEYILTDSFHGVAFSIIFNKEFFVHLSEKKGNSNSRIENILSIFNLRERQVSSIIELNKFNKIKYYEVNERLNIKREESIKYLKMFGNEV